MAVNFGTRGPRTLRTKIPIDRPSGRPSYVETQVVNELARNAAVMKGWLIVNDRVATGTAVNSIRIKVVRSKGASELVSSRVGLEQVGDYNLKEAAKIAKATDVGYVRGEIIGAPHLKYALQGRPAGNPPPVDEIMKWMLAKGVSDNPTRSLRHQATLIAKTIGAEGTAPPHFTTQMRTRVTRVSAAKLVRSLATVFPKYIGDDIANTLVALGTLYDNIHIYRTTPEQRQFEEFI